MNKYVIFFAGLTAAVFAVLIAAFIMLGGSYSAIDRDLDSTRHTHFTSIKMLVESFAERNYRLPYTLTEANATYYKDPQTNKDYTYTITGPKTYKICATFSTDTTKNPQATDDYSASPPVIHKKGYDCMGYTVNSVYFYRPTPTPTVAGVHRDGQTWCSNHGGIALTIPYDVSRGDWKSCLAWCDTEMTKKLPLCQFNSDGPRNCWVNYAPGGVDGDIKDCKWLPGAPPYGAWWNGFETAAKL